MRYSGLMLNDIAAAPGLSVTFFTQGCPHRCKGCHNPQTWDYDGGMEFTPDVFDQIRAGLTAQGIQRNFCVMGGEPLCPENVFLTFMVVKMVREEFPLVPIYIWSGYTYEELRRTAYPNIKTILDLADFLIDGPYIESLRDITLEMRGSSNQRIIALHD